MDDFSFSRDPFAAARSIPAVDGVGFMHNRLDRDTEHRDETSIPVMLADSDAGFYLFHKDTLVVETGATKSDALRAIFDKGAAEALGADMETVIILGTDPEEDNAPRLAALISDAAAQKLEGSERYSLESVRTLGLHGLLPADQLGAIAQARGLLNWHESPPLLLQMRHQNRCHAGWRPPGLPELFGHPFPADRPGRNHAGAASR